MPQAALHSLSLNCPHLLPPAGRPEGQPLAAASGFLSTFQVGLIMHIYMLLSFVKRWLLAGALFSSG